MLICLQAGHKGTYTGSTGAPGERDWTSKIVPLVAKILREKGAEVYETDAKAYEDPNVTETDWDLFLAIHYDADIYNDRGGFVDFPDPSVDMVWERSKEVAGKIADYYFKETGIPERRQRSNANTKFYYMWQYLSPQTPCNLIECGVGWRKPEDFNVLRADDFADKLARSIMYGLGIKDDTCDKELDEMRESRNRWRDDYKKLKDTSEKKINALESQIDVLEEKLDKCTDSQNKKLCEYPYWQRVLSLLRCKNVE